MATWFALLPGRAGSAGVLRVGAPYGTRSGVTLMLQCQPIWRGPDYRGEATMTTAAFAKINKPVLVLMTTLATAIGITPWVLFVRSPGVLIGLTAGALL